MHNSSPASMSPFLSSLNEQQRKAVQHITGPLLIVAGAGSGKTRVLTYRIAHLLQENHALPSEILALTFTNKAAKEMKERIQHIMGEKASKLWMGTFHSVFSKILRFEAEKINFGKDFSIYDTSDSESLIKNIIRELGFDPKEIKPRAIQWLISQAKNQVVSPEEYANKFVSSTLEDIMVKVYGIYQIRLKMSNAMDFDDLLIKPIELFKQHPDVLEYWQDRFRFILIDEYQDTNRAQYTVTNMLASKYRNLCVVGDDAQSIYSFRGADISNILEFKNDYKDAVQVPLEQNYRSTKSILQCADSIIKKNTKQLDKTLWTQNDYGDHITVLENFDERDEANRVAKHILDTKLRGGLQFKDFAILYRTNYQSRVFEEALRRHDIPYQLVGGFSFYQRQEVKDVLAYLTLLVNPHDETNLLRIINEPSRGIGTKSLFELQKRAREEKTTLWNLIQHIENCDVYKPAQVRIREFVEMINGLKYTLESGASLTEVTRLLLERSGYMKALLEENSHQSLGRRENVLGLQNDILFYEESVKNPSLSSFLQKIALITDADKLDDNKNSITLMTVHGSKGLEFPVVFIVGLEEKLFPVGGRNGDETDIEEERRLFYVAITRAQKKLFLSHARVRNKYGEEQRQLRSRFLNEVDPGVVRNETGATIKQHGGQETGKSTSGYPGSGLNIQYDRPLKDGDSTKYKPADQITVRYDFADGEDPFHPGLKVRHATFGEGKILNRSGDGRNTRIVVFFKGRGQKTLMLHVAKLEPIP